MTKTVIDASRSNIFLVDPNDLTVIGHDTEHKKGEHPLWQARALEEADVALAENMVVNGFTTVIEVRKDGPSLEVVVGRRRVKAARVANELRAVKGLPPIKVKCEVKRGTDVEFVGRMIAENALREDVHPLDMASDLQGYLNIGASEAEAARACGKSVAQLKSLLKLLDLDSTVQTAVRKGKISVTAAIPLAALPREEQKKELAELKEKPTVATVTSKVKAKKKNTEAVQVPGKKLLKKLVAAPGAENVFSPDGVRAIRFCMGELNPKHISGLAELIREVETK